MHFWHLITRLGEAQIALPMGVFVLASRAGAHEPRREAVRWALLVAAAILVTTATKVAFIGWGIGSAALNFTGISGHTMFAAAVYPAILAAIAGRRSRAVRGLAIAAGCALAILVGASRVVLLTHSISEVVAGWLLGGAVAFLWLHRRSSGPAPVDRSFLLAAALWATLVPLTLPSADTHAFVSRLALDLSGQQKPFTRRDLLNGRV